MATSVIGLIQERTLFHGHIRKRTWTTGGEARTAWLADYVDQNGARRRKTFTTRKAAEAWLVAARGEVARGTHTPESTSITVAEAAALWLKRTQELEPTTRANIARTSTTTSCR